MAVVRRQKLQENSRMNYHSLIINFRSNIENIFNKNLINKNI